MRDLAVPSEAFGGRPVGRNAADDRPEISNRQMFHPYVHINSAMQQRYKMRIDGNVHTELALVLRRPQCHIADIIPRKYGQYEDDSNCDYYGGARSVAYVHAHIDRGGAQKNPH